ADLLDQPPEGPIDPAVRIAPQVCPSDRVLEFGQVHGARVYGTANGPPDAGSDQRDEAARLGPNAHPGSVLRAPALEGAFAVTVTLPEISGDGRPVPKVGLNHLAQEPRRESGG